MTVTDVVTTRAVIGGERSRVLQLVKAISTGNWGLVGRIVRGSENGWSEQGLMALRLWLCDVLGNTQTYYSVDERFGLDRRIPYPALVRAQQRADMRVRPSLAVAMCAMALMGL